MKTKVQKLTDFTFEFTVNDDPEKRTHRIEGARSEKQAKTRLKMFFLDKGRVKNIRILEVEPYEVEIC